MKLLKRPLPAWILWALTICNGVASQSSCEPAELGKPYTLRCAIPGSGKSGTMIWRVAEIAQCACSYIILRCDCSSFGHNATVETTEDGYLSTLTIPSPQKNQEGKNWTCEDQSGSSGVIIIFTCLFRVYARPETVTCEVPGLASTSDQHVTVVCETQEEVYPGIVCLFHRITNQSNSMNLILGNDVTVQIQDKQCSVRVLGTYLGPGDHQFGVIMYPDVTGDQTDKQYGTTSPNTTSIKIELTSDSWGAVHRVYSISNIGRLDEDNPGLRATSRCCSCNPSAELRDCPTAASDGSVLGDYIKLGTNHTCTCTRTDQTYFPVSISWKDKNGGTVSSVSQQDQSVILTFTAARDQAFSCILTNSLQWTKEVIYRPQVMIPPSIRTFKANNMINEVSVRNNSEVQLTCEAEGNPSPRLSLYKEDHGPKERLASVDSGILTFSKTMTCGDTGLYKCNAEAAESESSEGIRVYVLCALKLEKATSQNKVYRGEVSDTLDIIVPVIGHPGPTYLHLAGEQNVLDDGSYTVMFFDVDSPSGVIYIKFYDLIDDLLQKYSLNITSSQGSFVYSFEIRAGYEEDTEVNAGAVIGGVVAGLLVVNAVVVAVVCVYRKGLLKSCGKREDTSDGTYMNTIPSEDKDLPYQNAHNVRGEENMASSHYETVTDDQATSATDIPRVETDTEQTGPYENTL